MTTPGRFGTINQQINNQSEYMAHTKAGASTKNDRDSQPKMLGVKMFAGQPVVAGNIIVRQRGTQFRAGDGTRCGKDDTIYAVITGIVKFTTRKIARFTGTLKKVKIVSVVKKK